MEQSTSSPSWTQISAQTAIPNKTLFQVRGRSEILPQQGTTEEFTMSKPALHRILKDILERDNNTHISKNDTRNNPKIWETIKHRINVENQQQGYSMTNPSWYTSIIATNGNGLNSWIRRNRLTEWIKKQNPTICSMKETHLTRKEIYRLKVKDGK